MDTIINALLPVLIVIGLGAGLARVGFLDEGLGAGLNKLVFFLALPALLIRSSIHAGAPTPAVLAPLPALLAPTLLAAVVAWAVSRALPMAAGSRGSFVEAAFFGNLAYIGLPVLAHSLGQVAGPDRPEVLAPAVVTMVVAIVVFNIMSVVALQGGAVSPSLFLRHVVLHPLVLAGSAGLLAGSFGMKLPVFADRVLASLGGVAVPAALLCVGASLARARIGREIVPIAAATAIKILFVPAVGWLIARAIGLGAEDTRVALLFAVCPTAVAAFSIAGQMKGDADLVAGIIAVTTIVSFAGFAVVLLVT